MNWTAESCTASAYRMLDCGPELCDVFGSVEGQFASNAIRRRDLWTVLLEHLSK